MVILLFKTVNYNRNVENVEGRDEFRDKRLSAGLCVRHSEAVTLGRGREERIKPRGVLELEVSRT